MAAAIAMREERTAGRGPKAALARGLGRLLPAGLGPGGRRAALLLVALAAVKAVALVLLAEGIAGGVGAIEAGGVGAAALRPALVLAAAGALLRGLAAWADGVVAARGAAAARSAARARLVTRLLDPADAGRAGAGEAAELAANGLDALDDYFGAVLPAAANALVVPAALGAWILWRDWPSAVVLLCTVPLVPLFMALIGRHTEERTEAARLALARLADRMVELARGLPVLVGLGRDREQGVALRAVQDETRRRTRATLRSAFLSSLALELIATISVAVVAVLLGIRLLDGAVALVPALAVLVLAPECFGALRDVGAAFHAAQDGLAALRRVDELDRAAGGNGVEATGEAVRTPDGIEVRGLGVRYAGRLAPALEEVTLRFRAGETSALVGRSGGGKSTLLAELARRLGPGAVAPQTPAFLTDGVRRELVEAYGAAPADADAMLARLGLAAFADDDPAQLSPGEARRLAVAAALLRAAGAEVVLLDEPTAHLDEAWAAEVRAAIRALHGATVIVATHDPALIAAADAIVALPERPAAAEAAEVAAAGPETVPSGGLSGLGRTDSARNASPGAKGLPARTSASAPARGPKARWWLAVVLGLLAAGFGIALSAVSGWLIVRASEGPAIMYLMVAIVGVRFFGLARAAARYAERLVTHDAVLATVDRLRSRLWTSLASRGAASRRLLAGGSTADLLVARLGQLREELPRVLVPGLVGILVMAGAVVVTAILAPAATWPVALLLLVGAAGGLLATGSLRGATARRGEARAFLARRVAALAEAGPVLAANGVAPRVLAEVDRLGVELAGIDRRVARIGGLGVALATAGTLGAAVVALAAAGAGGVGGPAAAAIALLATAALEPVLGLLAAARRLPALRAAEAAVAPALRPVPAPPGGELLLLHDGPLELDDVAVRWPGAAEPAFAGATALVRSGEWLHVAGPSGAGKSTLLSALLGRLAAERGRIALGGVAVAAADPEEWRAAFGWCPQEAHVFDSTLRGNLLLARSRAAAPDEAELRAVLREVGLGPLLDELADGLDTRVGPGGRALSGGERQRLAVARLLLGGARLLLLDEPTAHLDTAGADALIADLRAATRDRTVVLVSHRAGDARPGDRVLRLGAPEAGTGVGTGVGTTGAPDSGKAIGDGSASLAAVC